MSVTTGKPRILIIDRDSGLRSYIQHVLHDEYLVDQALSGTLAMAILQHRTYDYVLASTDMPAGSGYRGLNILTKIRAIPGCEDVPVVLLLNGLRAKMTVHRFVSSLPKPTGVPIKEPDLRNALRMARLAPMAGPARAVIARPIMTAWHGSGA